MKRFAFLSCLLLCAAAVAQTEAVKGQPPDSLVAHMHEHQLSISQVKAGVITGDLDSIREPARWLAEHPTPVAVPAAWYSHVESMRAAARKALTAIDTATAGQAAAQMASACGSCHDANNIYDQFEYLGEPEDELGTVEHMLRHQWAADRMWEGLIGPSEDAWFQGTNLLLEVPLTPKEMSAENEATEIVREMARNVHSLAASAQMEGDYARRVEMYGQFLGNCAACHKALGQFPRIP